MSTRSEVITMPVVMKDEKKYAECVDVQDQLEKWTYEIYSAAGLCSSEPESSHESTPVITAHSRPDQPGSHVPPAASASVHCMVLKYHAMEINSLASDLLVQRIYVLGAILQNKGWIICTHSVSLTGIRKEVT